MSSPYPTLLLTALYLIVVIAGPAYMEHRPAYQLKQPIVLYNFGLVILSAYMCFEVRQSTHIVSPSCVLQVFQRLITCFAIFIVFCLKFWKPQVWCMVFSSGQIWRLLCNQGKTIPYPYGLSTCSHAVVCISACESLLVVLLLQADRIHGYGKWIGALCVNYCCCLLSLLLLLLSLWLLFIIIIVVVYYHYYSSNDNIQQ